MEQTVEVPEYDPTAGLRFEWDEGFMIAVSCTDGTVVLRANRPGLVSLARHLLTLAQENVPAGRHIHLDAFNALEDGSEQIIFERVEQTS